jgi:PII-like signaling protein
MQIPRNAMLLRVFIGEDDKVRGRPLYEAIVLKARELQLAAGATILRGPMSFGHSSRLHTAKILRLSEDLPIVIEIVDSEEKIEAFLPQLGEMVWERPRHLGEGPGSAVREEQAAALALTHFPALPLLGCPQLRRRGAETDIAVPHPLQHE